MIELGLRLAVSSRAARLRLALVAVGVATGTVFLLGALGYMNARDAMNQRVATRESLTAGPPHGPGILWAWSPVTITARRCRLHAVSHRTRHGPAARAAWRPLHAGAGQRLRLARGRSVDAIVKPTARSGGRLCRGG